MEIDIVGPQCHLTAVRDINHIFNCKLLTFPHYCFVWFFFSPSVCVCPCFFVFERLIPTVREKVNHWRLRAKNISVSSSLALSLFLMWTDVNICNMTGSSQSNTV